MNSKVLIKGTVCLLTVILCLASVSAWSATIEVSQPIYGTTNNEYDRNPSIINDGTNYWLFYTKGDNTSTSGIRGPSYDPDADSYVVYYKTAATIAGLAGVSETKLALSESNRPANFDQRVVSATYFDGKVYAFVSSGQSGTDRGLYYYEYSGGSWTGPTTLIADATARGGHVNVTSDDDRIYIVWESSDGSSDCYTWDGSNLSPKVDISNGNQPKITLFTGSKDVAILYVVNIEDGTGDIEVFQAATDPQPGFGTHSTAIVGAGLYDPCIFNDGTNLYVISAPYIGTEDRQYLVQAKSIGTSATWSVAKTVSYGGHSGTAWWEYWACGYYDGNHAYVFFTTETNNGPFYSDGEISYIKMNWDLSHDHYFHIQNAGDQSVSGDLVNVAAGTYIEQTTIDKSLTLLGAGELTTTIQAPPADRLGSVAQGGNTHDYIVAAFPPSGTINVRIEGFTVDANGENKSSGMDRFVGVFFRDVKGTNAGLFSCTIKDFATTEYESWGVLVYGDAGLTIDDNDVSGFTRDGIDAIGDDGTAVDPDVVISDNTVTGSDVPLNGINVGRGATGTISGNMVKDLTRSSPWAAVGILVYQSDGVTVGGGNTVENCWDGILLLRSDGSTVSGNTLTDNIAFHIGLDESDNNQVFTNTITGTATGTEDKAIGLGNGASGNTIGGSTSTDGNTITMAASTGQFPYVIYVQSTVGAGSNTIRYNTVTGGTRFVQVDGGNSGTTTISDNTVNGCTFAGVYLNAGDAVISRNALINTVRPVEFWGAGNVMISQNIIDGSNFDGINCGSFSGSVTIWGNAIINTTGKAIWNRITTLIDASGNWYGTNTPAGVATEVSGYVDYTPWLDDGTDTDPVAPGFQGDFSELWVDDDSPQSGTIERIQEAIDQVAGSTVNIAVGMYNEQVIIDKDDLTLTGPQAGVDPGCSGFRGDEATITYAGTDPTLCIVADNAVVDGFTIEHTGVMEWEQNKVSVLIGGLSQNPLDHDHPSDGNSIQYNIITGGHYNMYIMQSSDNTIQHNRLTASVKEQMYIIYRGIGGASPTRYCRNNQVLNNCFDKAGVTTLGRAIWLSGFGTPYNTTDFTGTLIQANTITDSGSGDGQNTGIYVNYADGTESNPITIKRNSFDETSDSWYNGFYAGYASHVVVDSNSFAGDDHGVIYVQSNVTNLSLTNNVITSDGVTYGYIARFYNMETLIMTGNTITVNSPATDGNVARLMNVVGSSNVISGNHILITGTLGSGVSVYRGIDLMGPSDNAQFAISDNTLEGNNVGTVGIILRGQEVGTYSLSATTQVNITGNTITQFSDKGIESGSLYAGTVVEVHHNSIVGNSNYGVSNGAGEIVNATDNWWGAYCGPHHPTTNPNGQGDEVSDNVDYEPWCESTFTQCDFSTTPPNVVWVDDDYTPLGTNDGHYWCYDAFDKIQDGVDAVALGGTVNVAAGTYEEQVRIDGKGVDLVGAGVGQSIIEAVPVVDRVTYTITQWTGSSRTIDACIGVTDAGTVNISGFTVDGKELGPDNFYGIHYFNTGGSVIDCRIEDITDAAHPSNSRVVSLVATHGDGETITINFSNNVIPNFQKGGILVMGPGATFTVNGNSVSGVVSSSIAGNCIQLSYGATGTTASNYVEGTAYTGSDWASTGILLFECGDVSMDGDSAYDCESGVNFSDWGWVYNHPVPVNLGFANLVLDNNEWSLGIQLSRDNSDVNMTVSSCDVSNSTGDGIDFYCTGAGSYYTGWDNGDLNATVTGSNITGSALDGIWGADYSGNANNVSISVNYCMFSGNVGSAINNDFTQMMDATACYWDDPIGPTIGVKSGAIRQVAPAPSPYGDDLPKDGVVIMTESSDALKGSGETIYGPIDYSPWWGDNYVGDPHADPWTWYVNTSNNSTIQEGIEAASSLDTLRARPGTYEENAVLDKSLTLLGAGQDSVLVYPATSDIGMPDPEAGPSFRGSQILVVEATDVTIEGFMFDGDHPTLTPEGTIDARNGVITNYNTGDWSNLKVRDCTAKNIYLRAIYASAQTPNNLSGVDFSNNTISNVKGSSMQSAGIMLWGSSGDAKHNDVSDASIGIFYHWNSDGNMDSNTVTTSELGLGVNNNDSPTSISHNTITDSDQGIQTIAVASPVNVESNQISACTSGVVLYGGGSGETNVWDNDIEGLDTYGTIGVYASTDLDPWGVGDLYANLKRNTINDNFYGIVLNEPSGNTSQLLSILIGGSLGDYNLIYDNINYELLMEYCNDDQTATYNYWGYSLYPDIEDEIFHKIDQPSLGLVTFDPAILHGDVNLDGVINVGDVVYLVNYLYRNGPDPQVLVVADVNRDGSIDVGDVVYLVNYLYRGGPAPLAASVETPKPVMQKAPIEKPKLTESIRLRSVEK